MLAWPVDRPTENFFMHPRQIIKLKKTMKTLTGGDPTGNSVQRAIDANANLSTIYLDGAGVCGFASGFLSARIPVGAEFLFANDQTCTIFIFNIGVCKRDHFTSHDFAMVFILILFEFFFLSYGGAGVSECIRVWDYFPYPFITRAIINILIGFIYIFRFYFFWRIRSILFGNWTLCRIMKDFL